MNTPVDGWHARRPPAHLITPSLISYTLSAVFPIKMRAGKHQLNQGHANSSAFRHVPVSFVPACRPPLEPLTHASPLPWVCRRGSNHHGVGDQEPTLDGNDSGSSSVATSGPRHSSPPFVPPRPNRQPVTREDYTFFPQHFVPSLELLHLSPFPRGRRLEASDCLTCMEFSLSLSRGFLPVE